MNKICLLFFVGCLSTLLLAGQNVGIGTSTPNTELHIGGGAVVNKRIQFTHAATGTTLTDGLLVGISSTGAAFITQNEALLLTLGTAATGRLFIDGEGRVSVGSNNPFPFSNFTVYDAFGNGVPIYAESNNNSNASIYINAIHASANAGIGFNRSGTLRGYVGFNNANNFFVNVGSFNNLLFANSTTGAVGIGTNAPTAGAKLDVNGTAKVNNLTISTGGSQSDFLYKSDATGTMAFRKGHTGLGLRYIICTSGIFPGRDAGNNDIAMIGEIKLFAGNFAPFRWRFCEGQLLTITGMEALFSIIGTQYGGNGTTNFALPDLKGAVPVGVGAGATVPNWIQGERSN